MKLQKVTIDCEQVVVAVGPWVKTIWDMLELPKKISIKDEKGRTHKELSNVEILVFTRRSFGC